MREAGGSQSGLAVRAYTWMRSWEPVEAGILVRVSHLAHDDQLLLRLLGAVRRRGQAGPFSPLG